MDLIQRMNKTVEYIEENLTAEIEMQSLSKVAGCSLHEFSHMFSFMAGMSVSEYIRCRRLSQAVFDIQNGGEKLIDIALKYCYESQAAFTRAFKELHGHTPLSARKKGIILKTYPKITFKFIIKGVVEMDFRIESKESFKIIGYKSTGHWNEWNKFFDRFHQKLNESGYYKAPYWQVWAFNVTPSGSYYHSENNTPQDCTTIVGAEYNGEPLIEGLDIEEYPAATWAVFDACKIFGKEAEVGDSAGKTYAKVMSEWLPLSNYKRNEKLPYLEVYWVDGTDKIEVWVAVSNK